MVKKGSSPKKQIYKILTSILITAPATTKMAAAPNIQTNRAGKWAVKEEKPSPAESLL